MKRRMNKRIVAGDILITLVMGGAIFGLVACGHVEEAEGADPATDRVKGVTAYEGKHITAEILTDTETGCEYMYVSGMKEAGLALMYNADGMPSCKQRGEN